MAKIKNDPSRYVTRSSLVGKNRAVAAPNREERPVVRRSARDFCEAYVDDGLYVNFKVTERVEKA